VNPSTKYFLRSLAPLGMMYIIISIPVRLLFGSSLDPILILIDSFFFALIFGGLMNFIYYGYVKAKLKRKPKYEELKPVQSEKVKLKHSLNELHQLLLENPLKDIEPPKLYGSTIRFSMPRTQGLIGEYLEIEASNEGSQDYEIKSRPKFKPWFYLFDNGKSLQNISLLKAHLEELGIGYS
jgi:hypothetical protein